MTKPPVAPLVARLERVEAFPAAASELLTAAADGTVSARHLREAVGTDRTLAAEIVRLTRQCGRESLDSEASLEQAIAVVGPQRVAFVALTLLCGQTLLTTAPPPIARRLWRHSVVVGALAGELAARGGQASPSAAEALGLLHEVGLLAVLRVAEAEVAELQRAVTRGAAVDEAALRIFGMSTAYLSVNAAIALRLPPGICDLLATLAVPADEPPGDAGGAVATAEVLATLIGYPAHDSLAEWTPGSAGLDRALELSPSLGRGLGQLAATAAWLADPDFAGGDDSLHERAYDALLNANRRLLRLSREHVGMRQQLDMRARETRDLAETFASLSMGLDAEALRYSILESLIEHYRVGTAFMVDSEAGGGQFTGVMFRISSSGSPDVNPIAVDLADFDQDARMLLTQGTGVVVAGKSGSEKLREVLRDSGVVRLAPLMLRGCCVGLLGMIVGRQGGVEGRGEYLNIIATAAALGLENARLYADALRDASIDYLTGIANRRAILVDVEQVAARSRADRGSFAVVIADLDHFKSVNDTLGHQAGDRYLKDVVGALKSCLGPEDLIGRYGGDEFLLLLPCGTREECSRRAEAARSAVEELGQRPRWSAIPARLGITLGIVYWDGDAVEASSLIALADQSLYEAKAAGRNRVGTPATPIRAPV